MKRQNILIAAMLVSSAIFGVQNAAKADSVQQIVNEANQLANEANQWVDDVTAQQRQYENALLNSCYQGNEAACREYNLLIERQNVQLDRALQQMRERNRIRNGSY